MKSNPLFGMDVLSVDQFSKDMLTYIFSTADTMRANVAEKGGDMSLQGSMMTALFYEPSSRTFGSFIAAMQRLGGGIIPIQGVIYSSVSKGETLPDTVRTFASYSDIVVIRHPDVGSAKIAAEFSEKPIINAGDGIGEHPTQALLDLYTITRHFKDVQNLTVTMVGDMLNGRTVHSLAKLLSLFPGITIHFVAPEVLRFPLELEKILLDRGIHVHISESLTEVLPKTDVLYVTRVQKERFKDLDSYEALKHRYIITPKTLEVMKREAIVMHPFPRVGEIAFDVDLDRRAVYMSEQMENGMYVRMALLKSILKP